MVGSFEKGAKNDEELYHDCWLSKGKCNHTNPKQWVEISSFTFSFLARHNTTINSIININVAHSFKVKANLDATNNNSCVM
jgi:hypothetical protein